MSQIPAYKIITNDTVEKINGLSDTLSEDEFLEKLDKHVEEQNAVLLKNGINNDNSTCYVIHVFESNFSEDFICSNTIDDAVQAMAIKEGVDLVQFENGNFGYVSYYTHSIDAFEIIGEGGLLEDEYGDDYDVILSDNGDVYFLVVDGKKYPVESNPTNAVPDSVCNKALIDGRYYYFGM